jgi:hypothetical protein
MGFPFTEDSTMGNSISITNNLDITNSKSENVFNSLLHSRMENDISLVKGFDFF